MSFTLDPRLAADTLPAGRLPLCHLLLMNDANYPWFILVPAREGLREIFELEAADQTQLLAESVALGRALLDTFGGDKLNVAALGNVVPQLHLHHVVRKIGDPAWPAPVWGRAPTLAYAEAAANERVARLRQQLSAAMRVE